MIGETEAKLQQLASSDLRQNATPRKNWF